MYRVMPTKEAENDVSSLVAYMAYQLKNEQAARRFLHEYDKQIDSLTIFPFGYRGIGFEYREYEIRMKPFSTYNIFFVVDAKEQQITILRVLKDLQNWKVMLHDDDDYSF